MSRRLVQFHTGVTAPDGYRERVNEYVYTCDMCQRERETLQVEQDICEDCQMIHEAAPELYDALLLVKKLIDDEDNLSVDVWEEIEVQARQKINAALKSAGYEEKPNAVTSGS